MSKAQALHKLMFVICVLFFLLVTLQAPAQSDTPTTSTPIYHHQLRVELSPSLKMLKAEDTITFPPGTFSSDAPVKLSFLLNKHLQITTVNPHDSITVLHPATQDESYTEYGLSLNEGRNQVSLIYSGVIYDPVVDDNSSGLISTDGATLFGNTYWIPTFLEAFKSFDISIQTPAEWSSLSQGQMVSREAQGTNLITRYKEIYPQEDVYLVAGPWKSYESDTSTGKNLRVFLRKDDSALAQNFLTTMPDYIQHYSELIAPYPYNSFSVVENIWETGYGMPSFTLLGPSVVRLPFILTSSLPHEILHNWWGNGVYVDYEKGNWSEGLTTYMADYWQQEKINADAAYRLKTLANFSDFVSTNPANDFPVRQFKGRHNSSSQAVGYGKSMMFFHMLDQRFGRDVFNKALQNFYNDNLFRRASFSDLQKSFEKTTNQKLDSFFTQWLDRKGAPQIELSDVKVMHWADGSYATTYELKQKQEGPYELSIPVTLTLPSGETKNQTTKMSEKSQSFTIVTSSRPTKISIDPDFHVFRNLYDEERPATLSIIFGNPAVHFFYNEKTPGTSSFVDAWSSFIEGKATKHNNTKDNLDLPSQGAIVLIGDTPAFASFMKEQLAEQKFELNDVDLKINSQSFKLSEVSSVIVTRLKDHPTQPVVWIRWSADNNPAEWAQRLTHYGSTGILVFKGRPAVLQSTWPVTDSPLQQKL